MNVNELWSRYSKVPERLRYALAAAILLAMAMCYYLFVYSDQQGRLTALEDEYRKMDLTRAAKRAYADNLPKYQARFAELQQSLNIARALLPDSADVPQFLAQLNSNGRDTGLTIERFEPRDEVNKDFYAEIAFKLQVRGTYHEIGMFIDQLARLDRIVNVTDIAMTTPKVENDKVVVMGTFVVKTFRFLSDTALSELEAKKAKATP